MNDRRPNRHLGYRASRHRPTGSTSKRVPLDPTRRAGVRRA